ncbi:MAG: hypothetical protein JWQ71_4981 [Pedosphaera sp.]|nr:hypothetical protein [Pedosphaera sp.]
MSARLADIVTHERSPSDERLDTGGECQTLGFTNLADLKLRPASILINRFRNWILFDG